MRWKSDKEILQQPNPLTSQVSVESLEASLLDRLTALSTAKTTNVRIEEDEIDKAAMDKLRYADIHKERKRLLQQSWEKRLAMPEKGYFQLMNKEGLNLGPIVEMPKEVDPLQVMNRKAGAFMPALPRQHKGRMTGRLVEQKQELYKYEHWKLYPKKVKEMLYYACFPRGQYDAEGKWVEGGYQGVYDKDWQDFPVFRLPADFQMEVPKNVTPFERLPAGMKGKYRFNVSEADLDEIGACDQLRSFLRLENAHQRERRQAMIQEQINKFGKHPWDCGRTHVQVASLTLKIKQMEATLKEHRKNSAMKRSIQKLVGRRKKLLQYLKRTDVKGYYEVLLEHKLRDMV